VPGRSFTLLGTPTHDAFMAIQAWAAASVLRGWIELYGVPRARYTDMKNVYYARTAKMLLSQFGLMCEKLGVRIIAASSPQATGRVERTHGTNSQPADQEAEAERDIKLRGDESLSESGVSAAHNARFAHAAASTADYHLPKARRQIKPEDIWCREKAAFDERGALALNPTATPLERRESTQTTG
jgi:hypothetical protein